MMRLSPRRGFPVLLSVALFALSGCLNLQPSPDPGRYYTLAPVVADAQPAVSLRVRVTQIPFYLQTKRLAVREGEFEIQYRDYERWTGPLEEMIERRVAARLADSAPEALDGSLLRLRILQLEGSRDGHVRFVGEWELRAPSGGETIAGGRFAEERPWQVADVESLVSLQGALLDAFGDALIAELAERETAHNSAL